MDTLEDNISIGRKNILLGLVQMIREVSLPLVGDSPETGSPASCVCTMGWIIWGKGEAMDTATPSILTHEI